MKLKLVIADVSIATRIQKAKKDLHKPTGQRFQMGSTFESHRKIAEMGHCINRIPPAVLQRSNSNEDSESSTY